jgi:hypothetical protein
MLPLDRRSFRPRSNAFSAASKAGYSGVMYNEIADCESESPVNSEASWNTTFGPMY